MCRLPVSSHASLYTLSPHHTVYHASQFSGLPDSSLAVLVALSLASQIASSGSISRKTVSSASHHPNAFPNPLFPVSRSLRPSSVTAKKSPLSSFAALLYRSPSHLRPLPTSTPYPNPPVPSFAAFASLVSPAPQFHVLV